MVKLNVQAVRQYTTPGCPLLFSCLKAINKLATIVDNGNSQSNIKLIIINTKIPLEANFVLFDSERLYTIWRLDALVFTLSIMSWRSVRYRRAEIFIITFIIQRYKTLATGVDNINRQCNIKFAIINSTITTKALLIFFDIARLYSFSRVCAVGS